MFSQMCNGGYVHLFILRVDKTSLAYLMELRLKIIFHQKRSVEFSKVRCLDSPQY